MAHLESSPIVPAASRRRSGRDNAANGARGHPRLASPGERAACFAAGLGVPLYLAVRGGGYDIVVRQEAGLVLWWFLAIGFLFGFLPRSRLDRSARLGLAAMALLVGWTLLGLSWTGNAQSTFAEAARTIDYAGLAVLIWCGLSTASWRAAANGLATAALLLPAIALLSRVAPGAFPPDPVVAAFGGRRLSYPLDYWNAVAAWCAMAVGIGVSISAHQRHAALRAASLAAVPVAGLVLYLTYSRAGIAAAALALLVVLGLARHRWTVALHGLGAMAATGMLIVVVRGEPAIASGSGGSGGAVVAGGVLVAAAAVAGLAVWTRRAGVDALESRRAGTRAARGAIVVALAAVAICVAVAGPTKVAGGGGGLSASESSSDPAARLVNLDTTRWAVWGSALRAFEAHPLRGLGAGTFDTWWIRDGTSDVRLRDAHSLYIEDLAELGLPGLALLAAFLGALLARALRACRAARRSSEAGLVAGLTAAFAAYLFQAGVDWLWEVPAVTVLGLGAALIAGASNAAPRRRWVRLRISALAITALALAAGVAQVPGIVSTERARTAQAFLSAGLESRATFHASEAIAAEPWAADPYALRSLAELAGGRIGRARADALAAIDREPDAVAPRLLLVRIEVAAGNTPDAIAALEAIRPLAPRARPELDRTERALRSGATLPSLDG
jgi:hypothetical protein